MVGLADHKTRWTGSVRGLSTYTGTTRDGVIGQYYYRHRMYAAHLGRFWSRDPIGYEGRDRSLYGYVTARGTVKTDPSGLTPFVDVFGCVTPWLRECYLCLVGGNSKGGGPPPVRAGDWLRCVLRAKTKMIDACSMSNWTMFSGGCRLLENCYRWHW